MKEITRNISFNESDCYIDAGIFRKYFIGEIELPNKTILNVQNYVFIL